MKITDINMRGITCSSEVINELMSMTIDRITTLKTLNLTKFPAGIELDEAILDRLVQKCGGLTELTVCNMADITDQVRHALVNMIAKILKQNPPLTRLDLPNLGGSW